MRRGVIFIRKAVYWHSYVYLLCLFEDTYAYLKFCSFPSSEVLLESSSGALLFLFHRVACCSCFAGVLGCGLRGRQPPRRLRQVRERGSGSFGRRPLHASAGASLRVSREGAQTPPLPPRASHQGLHCLPRCGLTGSCSPFLISFPFGRTSGSGSHLTTFNRKETH